MNLKSYLRGIGVGVLVTAAVFIVSGMNDKNSGMSDAQIIARAKELGMIEMTTVADVGKNKDDIADEKSETEVKQEETKLEAKAEVSNVAKNDGIKEEENKTEAKPEENKAEVKTEAKPEENKAEVKTEATDKENKADDKSKDNTADTKPEEKKEDTKPVEPKQEQNNSVATGAELVIVVNSGDGSDVVSKKFFDAGLVDNAQEFDKFLMEKGYDRRIAVGNHKIKKGSTFEEMGLNLVSSTK